MARKALSKKIRFEVFKRDSFTCQYCGKSAPDVVLNADHIVPVVEGGDSGILNLVTSCFDCNSGKGKRVLSDQAVVTKQMDQIKTLNERKNQIEMIALWRAGLANLENAKLEAVRSAINLHLNPINKCINDEFLRTDIKAALSKYGLDEVLVSIEKSANQYLKDLKSSEHRDKYLTMIPRICYWSKHEKENPEIAQIRKLAYTANKMWWRCNPQTLTKRLLFLYQKEEMSIDELYLIITGTSGIMQFEDEIKAYFEELRKL